jgi:hypothetical protein
MRNMTRLTALLNAVLALTGIGAAQSATLRNPQYPSVAAAGSELRPKRHRHQAANDATGLSCVLDQ